MTSGATQLPAEGTAPRRVLVVDDHPLIREALVRRLSAADGFDVVGAVGTVADAVEAFDGLEPDYVLVDHNLPDGSGSEVLSAVKRAKPGTVVMMLSAQDDPAVISSYMAAGADGYAHKTTPSDELVEVLRRAQAGKPSLDATATAKVLAQLNSPVKAPRVPLTSPLSPREAQVLSLVADGRTNDKIARELYISPQTVKTHLARIFDKIGARDRASAAAKAIREGMLA